MKRHRVESFMRAIAFLFLLVGCKEKQSEKVAIIVNEKIFDSIPSGSGLERFKDSLFIVGDDAGLVYHLSGKDYGYRTISLHGEGSNVYRMEREKKTDYESAAIINYHGGEYLLAFGSGSKSPERDSLLIIELSTHRVDTVISIKPFYDHLMQVSKTDKASFNIEGATVLKDKLILLNRGNNMIYSFDANKFIEYVLTRGTPPALNHFRAVLPKIGNYEARLSGAAISGDDLLFCASVEQTTDWTKDGPIAGSFIGLLNEGKERVKVTAKLIYPDGRIAIDKLESVVLVRKEANGDMVILALADNDDGKTKLMEIRVVEKGYER